MAAYRLYFTTPLGSIIGRHDFDVDDDAAATRVAGALFDACSDSCASLDLWQGTRRIRVPDRHRSPGLADLSEDLQEVAVKTEEMIVRSEWAITGSRRLIERLEVAKQRRSPIDPPVSRRRVRSRQGSETVETPPSRERC